MHFCAGFDKSGHAEDRSEIIVDREHCQGLYVRILFCSVLLSSETRMLPSSGCQEGTSHRRVLRLVLGKKGKEGGGRGRKRRQEGEGRTLLIKYLCCVSFTSIKPIIHKFSVTLGDSLSSSQCGFYTRGLKVPFLSL